MVDSLQNDPKITVPLTKSTQMFQICTNNPGPESGKEAYKEWKKLFGWTSMITLSGSSSSKLPIGAFDHRKVRSIFFSVVTLILYVRHICIYGWLLVKSTMSWNPFFFNRALSTTFALSPGTKNWRWSSSRLEFSEVAAKLQQSSIQNFIRRGS